MSKEQFVEALLAEGFNSGFANTGIPTVFVNSAEEIKNVNKSIKRLIAENGYTQSYGISLLPTKA